MQEKIILYSSVLTSMGINLGFPKIKLKAKKICLTIYRTSEFSKTSRKFVLQNLWWLLKT